MVLDAIACFLDVSKGALLAPFSILASSLIGGSVAVWAILSNRRVAKLKNSMDFLNNFHDDNDIDETMKKVRELGESKASARIAELAMDDINSEEAQHIRNVLNYYESMAICIHRGIYDGGIIQEAIHTTVLDMWDTCKPYVDERRIRKKKNTFYQELEALVIAWRNNPLKRKKNSKPNGNE